MNTRLSSIPGLALAALGCLARPAHAQPAVEARLGVALDAVEAGAFEAETRGTIEGSFAPELGFASQHGRVYYHLDGGTYASPGDWSFLSHAVGASYRLDLNDGEGTRLYLGGSGASRRNGDAWSEADYDALTAFANLELRTAPTMTLRTGYGLAQRWFAEIAELDQLEQDVFASLNVNLRTRTTLIAESHVGWKTYAGETLRVALPPLAPSSVSPDSGRGRGSMGPVARSTLVTEVPVGSTGEQARQWNLLLRVAQGVGERTGIWAQGFARCTGGRVPPTIVATPSGFFDDGVYDDPFASDLNALAGGFKHLFAGGFEVQATGSWQEKAFTNAVALDAAGLPLPGDPLREDRITRGGVRLSLPALASESGVSSLALALQYGYTRSHSNDAFYDYRSHALGLALTFSR
ncbi:MAG TPA: hypothetical protein VKA01_08205 [Vicinamibacteria bacterium]|nr:hypothetical protein [Vicinamibacteria bacterium]